MNRVVKFTLGVASSVFLILIGALFTLSNIIAILDPVGTKMADDADPFGDPSIQWPVVIVLFVIAAICFTAAGFILKSLIEADKRFLSEPKLK